MRRVTQFCLCFCAGLAFVGSTAVVGFAQFGPGPQVKAIEAPKPKTPPKVPDEPRTIDPATLVPEVLAEKVTVKFDDSSLGELAQWLEDERKIVTVFDGKALGAAGIPLGEPVTDRLDDAPLYLMLNRLNTLGLAWYMEDNILRITTASEANSRLVTQSYNITDLLDAGFKPQNLSQTILRTTSGKWAAENQPNAAGGSVRWLGDVLFVRQTDAVHREIQGLLQALRKYGRRTFIYDPPQHEVLRQKLNENVSVDFRDTPLVQAIADLAAQSGADIRLDLAALRLRRIRDREPVTLTLADRKLQTVLPVLLADLDLTWVLRDGVMWITSSAHAAHEYKTAVYFVEDLCQNDNESMQLQSAIESQTEGRWSNGEGVIYFARTGAMVVRQTERVLTNVETLLENYRKALRQSKPRKEQQVDPKEVVTRYYRMHSVLADDLENKLSLLVAPGSWKSAAQPEGVGTILKVASIPDVTFGNAAVADPDSGNGESPQANWLTGSRSVLIVTQTRENHDKIEKVLQRIEFGDQPAQGGMGMGGMSGGFGSGLF